MEFGIEMLTCLGTFLTKKQEKLERGEAEDRRRADLQGTQP
uniref:Uncharacterized protein n=1 Tax=Geobacter sp. (strain M21) TaxID=443144 RepID=C6E7P3_GEOSM